MITSSYADRLRETIAAKMRLRSAFTSPGLVEDNERQLRLAQVALCALEQPVAGANPLRSSE